MGPITESRITEIVLLFLRARYKYHPLRSGNIEFKTNLKGSGYLFVDGTVSFTRDGAPDFLASIEATDYLKRDELWFRVLWELAAWDALAGSTMALSAIFAYMHFSDHLGPFKGNPWLLTGAGCLLLAVATWLVFLAIRPFRRYRYIYAIEQFKRYEATEQWVAFAWDVFPGYTVPVFTELREQCVLNGLGLLEVDREGKVKMHLSPAREGMPARKNRRVVHFFSEREWSLRLPQQTKALDLREKTGALLERWTGKKVLNDLFRFKRPILGQVALIAVSASLTLGLMVREYGKRPVVYEREKAYERLMLAKKQELERASGEFFIPVLQDSVYAFNKNAMPYLQIVPDSIPPWENTDLGWITFDGGKLKSLPCEEAYLQFRGRYIVTAGLFFDMEYLKTMIERLQKAGIQVNAIWGACFFDRSNYFMLVFPEIFDQAEAAQRAAVQISTSLYGQGFNLTTSFVQVE
jgi:hypothetical protein